MNLGAEKPARALVLLVVLAITLTVVSRSGFFPPVDRAVTDAAIVLLPLAGFVLSLPRLTRRRTARVGTWIAVVFAIAVTLAGLVNGPGIASVFGMLLPAMMAVVLTLIGGLLSAAEFRTIARCIVALAVAQTVFAIADVHLLEDWARQAASIDDVYVYRPNLLIDGIGRAPGTMGHPILLGLICTIGAVLVLSRDVVRSLVFRMILVAFLGWGVVLSGSRSSVAALAVAVLLYFIHPASPTKRWVRVWMVIVITPLTLIYVNEAVNTARDVSLFSLTNRIDALPRLWETLNRPFPFWVFGEGVHFSLDTVADNQFLTASGSYGLIGLLAFIAAIAYALRSRSPIALAVVGCLAFMSLSFDTLTWSFSTLMFWLMVGFSHSHSATTLPNDAVLANHTDPGLKQSTNIPLRRRTARTRGDHARSAASLPTVGRGLRRS